MCRHTVCRLPSNRATAAADVLASMLTRDTAFKQLVLEAVDHNERMRLVVGLLRQVR